MPRKYKILYFCKIPWYNLVRCDVAHSLLILPLVGKYFYYIIHHGVYGVIT